jgi:hypothetical protein
MTTMIERVANAMDECPEWPAKTYRNRVAQAAIEAMREPTDLMGCCLPQGYKAGSHSATQIWRAMIDAALNESKWAPTS